MQLSSAALRAQHNTLSLVAKRAMRTAVKPAPHVDAALLEAIASRETNMRNIVGDHGHGRGMFQQDDRFQQAFLAACRGCRSGSSIPVYKSARPAGRVPTTSAGARRCVAIIELNVGECKRRGVAYGDRLFVAVAGYNRGITGAINGYKQGGRRGADSGTANGDYATDVLSRAAMLRKIL